jgi:hypothetical protein
VARVLARVVHVGAVTAELGDHGRAPVVARAAAPTAGVLRVDGPFPCPTGPTTAVSKGARSPDSKSQAFACFPTILRSPVHLANLDFAAVEWLSRGTLLRFPL